MSWENWEGIEQGGKAIAMLPYSSANCSTSGHNKCSINVGKMNGSVSEWMNEWAYAEGSAKEYKMGQLGKKWK